MNHAVKDQLRRLVQSLSKAEKRNFKLYAKRIESNADSKFVQLFDLIDKQEIDDDEALLHTVADGVPGKLSNLKRHLYQQVLVSLRLLYFHKELDIEIRQQIDFARILYGKGHYLDALRLLEKTRLLAFENNFHLLLLEVLEFQKMIEARHVTLSRQMKGKMDQLLHDANQQSFLNLYTSLQSSLNIQIQGYYIINGHARNEAQQSKFYAFWQVEEAKISAIPAAISKDSNNFFERIHAAQARMWNHYILLDFHSALEVALEAYNTFLLNPQMALHDPDLYMRILYYINSFSFLEQDSGNCQFAAHKIDSFIDEQQNNFNQNSQEVALVYRQLCQLNLLIIHQDWEDARLEGRVLRRNEKDTFLQLPSHRLNLFLYKFAAIEVARKKYERALDHLREIIDSPSNLLRDDLLINTKLLRAICYLETNDLYLADYEITNLSRMVRRNKYTSNVHTLTLSCLRQMLRSDDRREWPELLFALDSQLEQCGNTDRYDAKTLRFIDLRYWIAHR